MRGYPSVFEALRDKLGIAVPDEPVSEPRPAIEPEPNPLEAALREGFGIAEAESDSSAEPERVDIGQGNRGTAHAAPASPYEQMIDALEHSMDVSARRWGHPFGDGGEAGWRRLG